MKPLKRIKLFTMMTIAFAAIAIIFQPTLAVEELSNDMARDLSALFPNTPRPLTVGSIHFLNQNRLLVVTDRLTIVDLDTMEKAAEIPNPIPNDEAFDFSVLDRVYRLRSGFIWITERSNDGQVVFYYYEFDDKLNVLREFEMVEKNPADSAEVFPDYRTMDITPDGKEIYYFGFGTTSGLYRQNLDTDKNTLLYATTHDASLNTLDEIWLVNGGATIVFRRSDWIVGPNFETEKRFGTIAADGTNLSLKETSFIEENLALLHRTDVFKRQPASSPVVLVIPDDPQTTSMEEKMALPPKTIYAWNVLTDEVIPIPLQRTLEDYGAVLSESGRFIATAVFEAEGEVGGKVVFRLYNAADGTLRNQFELRNQSEAQSLKIAISENEGLIRAVFNDTKNVRTIAIPFD